MKINTIRINRRKAYIMYFIRGIDVLPEVAYGATFFLTFFNQTG